MTEETIFEHALEKRDPGERAAFLVEACGDDAELRRRVEVLLQAHDQAGDFLERPAVEQVAAEAGQPAAGTEAIDSRPQARDRADETQTYPPREGDLVLNFLRQPRKEGSLGRLAHYEILEVLGRGGFGIVLKAFDEKLHRVVAIKVLSPQLASSGTARKRFIREAHATAAVRHENVIDIHAVDDDPLPYLVMECISGQTLQEKLDKSGSLELKEILRIGHQIASGLDAAHAQGLIHRDIKPSNILLENGVERVKITDFGLARAVDDASLTQSGVVAGTPLYMAPEQAAGEPLDHRADLFSLGSTLYVMCTGRPPFRASGTMAVLKRVIEDTPRPIHEINREIPQWLCAVIERLHAKNPADRFPSAKEVAELLARYLLELQLHGGVIPLDVARQGSNPPPVASGPSAAGGGQEQTGKAVRSRRKRWLLAGAIVLGLAAVGAPVVSHFLSSPAGPPLPHLVIFSDDPDLTVEVLARVENPPPPLRSKGATAHNFQPEPGDYELRGSKNGKLYRREFVTLAAGDKRSFNWKRAGGWVQLFNGKDLTWWKTHPDQPGDWKVENGLLVGRTANAPSHLFSERGDYEDFHFRVEAKINERGDSGQFFRCAYGAWNSPNKSPLGYEANISFLNRFNTGSLWGADWPPVGPNENPIAPDTWFTQEVIARGNHIVIKVNGKTTTDFVDPNHRYRRGHLALQAWALGTVVQFRKIEIKELPPSKMAEPGAPFVILGKDAKAERKFATLAEAVTAAGSGDTIEIRGDGPFVTEPVSLKKRSLVLRAGTGFVPTISLAPQFREQALLETDSPLLLEGLKLQNARVAGLVRAQGTKVALVNCSFEQGTIFLGGGNIRNCRFGDCPAFSITWSGMHPLKMENCLFSARDFAAVAIFEKQHSSLSIRHCTFAGNEGVLWVPDLEKKLGPEPQRMSQEHNLFASKYVLVMSSYVKDDPPGSDSGAHKKCEELLRKTWIWKEVGNLYATKAVLLTSRIVTNRGQSSWNAMFNLAGWNKFWDLGDSKSQRGEVVLTPDFRLADGSPGKGAGPGGKDLGADVDLVGPGAAYERWRQTPAYQEWRRKTEELMKGP